MEEILQEYVNSGDVDMRVDGKRSVIHGVKLLGFRSRNGRTYLPAALEQASGLYEGAKVNLNPSIFMALLQSNNRASIPARASETTGFAEALSS